MQKPNSAREKETHKILQDFEIQTDHPIPTKRPNLVLINKKKLTCHQMGFTTRVNHRVKAK